VARTETYVETYLQELQEIRSSGEATSETSYYPPLRDLFNSVGGELKPKVRCILTLKNRGAGLPDGGLFTKDQFQRLKANEPLPGQKPGRGAIEVKPTSDDAWVTADSDQVTKYWREYGQVLVTNYRDFVLVGRDAEGAPVKLASYSLAADEKAFWRLAARPRKAAQEQGARFVDFLKLAILSPAILVAPKDVAWILAYYAREAKARVEAQAELPALANIRAALEQSLGLEFEGEKGEHFFRSSLVQTLFYGVFSAWVLWSKRHPSKHGIAKEYSSLSSTERFDWRLAQWSLRVPMIRVLFEQVATPGQLEPIGLVEVLDWTEGALNRVDRSEFFARFQEQEAVQYFYEPFLEAFDPELRKELGVWYTPIEIVKYMVARTHAVLREELNLEDGLADPNVYVLDPGCGTGAYLVEVLKTIAATLKAKGIDALAAQDVKQAAMHRIFGFELLPAPFVISHLQLGLLLQNLGAPLAEDPNERVGVYLTNSLTGWEPPKGAKLKLAFPEMEAERDAAEKVKRDAPILVIMGNPPYNAFAGVSPAEEEGLVEPYKGVYWVEKVNKKGKTVKDKQGQPVRQRRYKLTDPESLGGWDIRKFNLDDLYVRFFRLAERRLTEKSNKGIISYISNYSYLSDPSYVIMRERLISNFGKVWIDCMNGDSRETGKTTPLGMPDPSVFSTEKNPEGIRLGTAICLMLRSDKLRTPTVNYRDFWGVDKRKELLNSLETKTDRNYELARPSKANRFSLRPSSVTPEYDSWPRPIDLCGEAPISGLQEMRGEALINIDRKKVRDFAQAYYDPRVSWNELQVSPNGLTDAEKGFDEQVRLQVQATEKFREDRIKSYALYPLDPRWCYWTPTPPLWNRARPSLVAQEWAGNSFFIVRMFAERAKEGPPLMNTSFLPDYHLLRPNAVAIPYRVRPEELEDDGHHGRIKAREDISQEPTANLSLRARQYLAALGIENPDGNSNSAAAIWQHSLAIGYSQRYLSENVYGVRYNWPRIPLPASEEAFVKSAELGERVAELLNTEAKVEGVTASAIRPELRVIGNTTAVEGGSFDDPARDLLIDAGWGHPGKEGVTMPGKGKLVERDYTNVEREAIVQNAAALGLSTEQALAQLGERTCDVYLNARAYWQNIPVKVWDYYIGGYQVIKKWLSYREGKLLGRALTVEEAHYVRDMARRIAAICLLQPHLDANYTAVKADTYAWPISSPD
jgi:hypothetical protein